jgi:hypothetical protein
MVEEKDQTEPFPVHSVLVAPFFEDSLVQWASSLTINISNMNGGVERSDLGWKSQGGGTDI